ncbi:MAG: TfoX/Sxy family protein [Deltaproteobacteria bacterium]|nr:TfoX/Sxy family protein [Deltaproteobacteria bacterium]
MAFDEGLAQRLREALEDHPGVIEKKMFGGVAFMLDGKMFVGVVKEDLMVRVGPDQHDDAVARPHARTMDFTGRPMRGYVFVAPEGYRSDAVLRAWVKRGLSFVATLSAKAAGAKKPPKKRNAAR